ncbi:MAG: PIG-L family deacetylase [Gemmatimonadota bacterium]|nr:PIG-L family deacetylase [Gemmatimonadota bacterium]
MNKRILVVAPHPDDETLGAGGTIAKFVEQGHEVSVLVVSGHLPPVYSRDDYETTVREAEKAFAVLGVAGSRFLEIPATMVGEQPVGVLNGKVATMVKEIAPHIVLCPFPDRHIDHRVVFESVMVATRPVAAGRGIEMLAAYETLSETHWNAPHMEPNFVPNWVVDITAQIGRKIDALTCYESQIPAFPGARSVDAAKALAVFRGTQAGFSFGEGFQIIRMVG